MSELNMSEKQVSEALKILSDVENFVPVADALSRALEIYGPYLGDAVDKVVDYKVARTIESFKQYEAGGFTRQEAMLLLLNSRVATQDSLRNMREALAKAAASKNSG